MERLFQSAERAEVARLTSIDEVDTLVEMFEGIAAELSWQPGDQIRAYASQAVHFGAYVDGALAGGVQLVMPSSGRPMPWERVWPDARLPRPDKTAHIAILAVRREFRGAAGLLWPLGVALWRHCAASGIVDVSLEATPMTYRAYRRLGWPLEVVGDLRLHWGEDCLLCRMGVAEVAGSLLLRATRSASYRRIVAQMGQALEVKGRAWEPQTREPLASCGALSQVG